MKGPSCDCRQQPPFCAMLPPKPTTLPLVWDVAPWQSVGIQITGLLQDGCWGTSHRTMSSGKPWGLPSFSPSFPVPPLQFFPILTPNTVTRDKWVCFKHFIYKKYIFFLSTFSTHHFFFIQVKGGEANTPCCQNQENLLGCPQDQRRKL